MAEEYPYAYSAGKLKEFLEKLKETGVPEKINLKWLESLGYKSKNDRSFLSVLRFLDLIDDSGSPTESYRETLRGGNQGRAVFAKIVRDNYADLFSTYPDAHRKDNEALQNFFTAHTDVGSKAIQMMVTTFKSVCSFADFESEEVDRDADDMDKSTDGLAPEDQTTNLSNPANSSVQPLVINVNIQLEIPATSDSGVYG